MRIEQLSSDERGAAVVFVAILLVVIFGMVVLVVDVGGLLVLRGRMVAAADSGSLAAAQSCASDQLLEAQAEADEVAFGNLSDVPSVTGGPINSPACGQGAGTVSVTYSGVQDLYFAPVLGFDSTHSVSGSATAMWGPSTGAEPIPIALSTPCSLNQLSCAYWFDAENELDENTFANTFGFVHLTAWRRFAGGPSSSCPNGAPPSFRSWVEGSETVPVKLRHPSSTFACPVVPQSQGSWEPEIQGQLGNSRIFVITDPNLETEEQYAPVGFSPLTIQSLSQGVSEQVIVCEEIEVNDLVEDQVIDLTLQVLACLLEFGLNGIEIQVAPEGLDYQFNPITNTFRWLDEEIDSITITIGGTQPANGGECGEPVPPNDPWCLVLSNEGPEVGGTEPNDSAIDFGLRAIRLSE